MGHEPLPPDHADYRLLQEIYLPFVRAAGGLENLECTMAAILRDCIDRVIQTPKTGRLFFTDLQNSEKTYIGTAVEIDLRSALGLPRGQNTDLIIGSHEVDVKFTRRAGWMIPPETVDKPCLLVSADDTRSRFSVGMVLARSSYLNSGLNRDGKTTIRADARSNIWWVLREVSYPENFWLTISPEAAKKIADGRSGNDRVVTLFQEVQDRVVPRKVIEDVARQLDPIRRLRADGTRGTRARLRQHGIEILEGSKPSHRHLVAKLGLPSIKKTEYLAHRFTSSQERQLAIGCGVKVGAIK